MRLRPALLLAVLAAALCPAAASAADVPAGATWTQATIPSSDGVKLHADILRPKGATAKTPVILSIGPYFNHAGQTGPAGPVEGTSYDPVGPSTGPSDRFLDFVEGAKLMERGYTFMMVDLRGFGGSTGCLDWGGPGEQSDVVNAVQWAASQPWSTGKVGMYGKSYDGVTGPDRRRQAARRASPPSSPRSRSTTSTGTSTATGSGARTRCATPALYDLIDATPGPGRRRPDLQRQRRQRHASAPAAWPPTTPTRPPTTTTTRRTGRRGT